MSGDRAVTDRLAEAIDALLVVGPCDPCYEDHDYAGAAECECSCHRLDTEARLEGVRAVRAYRLAAGAGGEAP